MNILDFSIIVPVYYNEGSVKNTFERLHEKVIKQNDPKSFEVIFIDDGSKDQSLKVLLNLKNQFPELVKIIKFTRNFGQVSAMQAGYEYARGKTIINISADLQDPPELINKMIEVNIKEGYDIVICSREDREEGFFRKITSRFFYRLMKKLSFAQMPKGGFDFVLMNSKVKDALLRMKETNPFWQGQILWTGYKAKFIPYTRLKRESGKSRWTFSKKIKYLLDGVMGYSYLPLRVMSVLGILLFIAGVIYATAIAVLYFFGNVPFKGWAPIMILILILSGIQMLMLGIIGEYLWRTLDQARNREKYIIEEVYE
jgi:glycosyltransferase involved in cell wall biosynthesis